MFQNQHCNWYEYHNQITLNKYDSYFRPGVLVDQTELELQSVKNQSSKLTCCSGSLAQTLRGNMWEL